MKWIIEKAAVLALVLVMAVAAGAAPAAAQVMDSAHAAWARGDLETAVPLYEQRLARDSSDVLALHRLALVRAWDDRTDESLALYDRLLRIDPGNTEARLDRANALAWAERHDEAIAAVEGVLAADPGNTAALAALGRFSSWAGNYDEAERAFRTILERDPDDLEARRGLARVASWRGRLREGERRWREVLSAEPRDVEALVGLAMNLRWQGRTGEAMAVLDRAEAVAPDNADVREQRQWIRAAAGPAIVPTYLYERDSDGIGVETLGLTARWLVARRVGLQLTGENRTFDGPGDPDIAARSAELVASVGLGGGWTVTGGGGVRFGSGAGMENIALWRVGAATPTHLPVSVALAASRRAFDHTARLARSGVTVDEGTVTVRGTGMEGRLRTSVVGGVARFDAAEDNTRWLAGASASYRAVPALSVGVNVRTFGFSDQVDEGYWNPERYGIAELPVVLSLRRDLGAFGSVEVAPGYQSIDNGAVTTDNATLRLGATAGYRFAPGRALGISAMVANSGLQRVSPVPEADYEYRTVRIFFDWSLR